jgi:tRNA (guanine37-N1)-methyltransferase
MKHFDIISIFSNSLDSYFGTSILKRAQEKKLIKILTHDLRKYTTDKHHKVDDRVYGGGAGMVMKVEPIVRALHELIFKNKKSKSKIKERIILLAANGKQFTQKDAKRLFKYDRLVFICGRYEGVDARVEKFIDEKISIGNYVVTGGELPAAIVIDAVSRMIPGVVGKEESVQNESFSEGVNLEYPQYTRPEVFMVGKKKLIVPKVLLGGNHKEIQKWRSNESQSIK